MLRTTRRVLLLLFIPIIFLLLRELGVSLTLFDDYAPIKVYRNEHGKVRSCTIPQVCDCVGFNGKQDCTTTPHRTLYVPERYRNFSTILQACGGGDGASGKIGAGVITYKFYSGTKPKLPSSSKYYAYDILGRSITNPWVGHMGHFTNYFVGAVLSSTSLFLYGRDLSVIGTEECLYPQNKKAVPCGWRSRMLRNPVLIVSEKVYKSSSWVNQMINLMIGNNRNRLLIVRRPSVYECYRTLTLTNERYNVSLKGHDFAFRQAGIRRTRSCKRHVVILNRHRSRGRRFPVETVQALVKELKNSTHVKSVEAIENLGHLTFREQIKLMQRADVLVSPHGAEFANSVFLRPHSSVIEVIPFGYWTLFFRDVIRRVGAEYTAVPAPPDVNGVRNCMRRTRGIEAKGQADFEEHVKQYSSANNQTRRDEVAKFFSSYGRVRSCLKKQILRVQPRYLADLISERIRVSSCNKTR